MLFIYPRHLARQAHGPDQTEHVRRYVFIILTGIPIFPGRAVNFECLFAPLSFKSIAMFLKSVVLLKDAIFQK
jgi:hypothetical protein